MLTRNEIVRIQAELERNNAGYRRLPGTTLKSGSGEVNTLFAHPYTKIEFLQRDLNVSRITATRYIEALAEAGFVSKHKVGKSNYYVNHALQGILFNPAR